MDLKHDIKQNFASHDSSVAHKEAFVKATGLRSSLDTGSIATATSTYHKNKNVIKNRSYLKCIVETLLFCANQEIAIRGHETNSSENKDNFLELLFL